MVYFPSNPNLNSNWGYKIIVSVHTRGNGWSCTSLPLNQLIDNPLIVNKTNLYAPNYCSWTGISCNFNEVSDVVLKGYIMKGSVPSSIGLLQQLSRLDFSSNLLSGKIPSSIGGTNMANLQYLDLSFNRFTGPIPTNVLIAPSLSTISLTNNLLTGTLSSFSSSQLNLLHLDNNKFYGKVTQNLCGIMQPPTDGKFTATGNPLLTSYEPCWQNLVKANQIFDNSVIFCAPTGQPTSRPSMQPSKHPLGFPTEQPSLQPYQQPSSQPSTQPSQPTSQQSTLPSKQPSIIPTYQMTDFPTNKPSKRKQSPTMTPSILFPSYEPSTSLPSRPTENPSYSPSIVPTYSPSIAVKVNGDGCFFKDGTQGACNLGFYCLRLLCYFCPIGEYCNDGITTML